MPLDSLTRGSTLGPAEGSAPKTPAVYIGSRSTLAMSPTIMTKFYAYAYMNDQGENDQNSERGTKVKPTV